MKFKPEIRTVPVSKIKPSPYHARKDLRPDHPGMRRLVKSYDTFGQVQLGVLNQRTGHLVGGNQGLKILQARGVTHVQVIVVDLSLEEEKALCLALNNHAGEWDQERLTEALESLHCSGLDLDLTGFDASEFERLTAGIADDPARASSDADAAQPVDGPAVTRPGELIELGACRLFCGDATIPENWATLLGERKARLVFTDPPYNVAYDPASRPGAKSGPARAGSARFGAIRGDAAGEAAYEGWFTALAGHLSANMAPGAPYYIFNGHAQFGLMHRALFGVGLVPSCVLTWAKESFSPGFGDYNQQTEFCLYGWKKGAKRPWYGPKNETTLWEVRRDPSREYVHPTQKALELAERALRNSSRKGDLVLDPFLGSGTTLIASARMGRVCAGMELDPRHCDSVVRRYVALAGESAVAEEVAERYRVKKAAPAGEAA